MSESGAVLAEETPVPAQASRPSFIRQVLRWRGYPLLAILVVQGVVSGRLAWVNGAFGDEANYLAQGLGEWHAWLNGLPVPAFHDSGAPQIYPPLGAAVSALGGLPAARLLSLAFMLAATTLLYLTARRLFGRPAALWAAALGGFNEPVLRLDFATYDPMAIMLLMVALYLAVRSATAYRAGELVAASGILMLLTSLVAVSYVIYLPVVMAVMWCSAAWLRDRDWGSALVPVIWQFILIGGLTVVGVSALHVWSDFVGTTVNRKSGLGVGVRAVLGAAWGWGALVFCVAIVGAVLAIFAFGWGSPRAWLVLVLTLAAVVVPAYQAYIGTAYSMDKHMAPGAEMAAMAGGYAISRVVSRWPGRSVADGSSRPASPRRGAAIAVPATVSIAVVAATLGQGAASAWSAFRSWPDTRPLAVALRAAVTTARPSTSGVDGQVTSSGVRLPGPGSLLVGTAGAGNFNPATFRYYLPHTDVTVNVAGDPVIAASIRAGRYSIVVQQLNSAPLRAVYQEGGLTPALRTGILSFERDGKDNVGAELAGSHRYVVTRVLPYITNTATDPDGVFVIWSTTKKLFGDGH